MANKDYCVYKHTAPNGKVYKGMQRKVKTNWWIPLEI